MGSKSSRTHVANGEALSKETIEELSQETGFTEDELLNWHTNFYKDCPDGKLTSKQFEHEYSKVMGKPTHKTIDYVKHMFNVYDQDKNQFIDFREFIMALSAASVVNRLRLVETLFHVFDLDNDGKITKAEIGKMLHTLVDVTESNRKHRHQHHHIHTSKGDKSQKAIDVQKRVDDAFDELNANDDDHITKDEFIEWYIKSGLLADTKTDEIQVPDATRIQQLEKKTRKTRKQQVQVTKPGEEWRAPLQNNRYMSHMTEIKVLQPEANDDDDIDSRKHLEVINGDHETHSKSDTDDTDSHSSKENERWQYLFNSVLGQIRAQRLQGEKDKQNSSSITEHHLKHFHSWKQDAEEKLKTEYLKHKSQDSLSESSPDNRSPNDVVRVRL